MILGDKMNWLCLHVERSLGCSCLYLLNLYAQFVIRVTFLCFKNFWRTQILYCGTTDTPDLDFW